MIVPAVVFSSILVFLVYVVLQQRTKKQQEKMIPKDPDKIQPILNGKKQKRRRYFHLYTTLPGIAGGAIGMAVLHGSPIVGGTLGGFLPWMVLTQLRRNYQKRYRTDAVTAIKYSKAVFASNGTVEDWIVEVVPRLVGPLRGEFEYASKQYKKGIPVPRFLEFLSKDCPDEYFEFFLRGILANYRDAGDLMEFADESAKMMNDHERYVRNMAANRKSGQSMFLTVLTLPVMLYLLFRDTLETILNKYPLSNLALIISILGYIGFYYIGVRITSPVMKK